MDEVPLSTLYCACGKSFTLTWALERHQRKCNRNLKRLGGALSAAQANWQQRKKRRIEASTLLTSGTSTIVPSDEAANEDITINSYLENDVPEVRIVVNDT